MMKTTRMLALLALLCLALTPAGAASAQTAMIWQAAYWNNPTFSGAPSIYQAEIAIDHNWGTAAPAAKFPADNFSVKWVRYVDLAAGTYRFTALSDDGMRVYLNGELIIDDWGPHGERAVSVDKKLPAGKYYIEVLYYDIGGPAVAMFNWYNLAGDSGWQAEFFNNKTLSGLPALVRTDSAINFDFGTGSPATGINADNFSARWSRTLNLGPGTYRFEMTVGDGGRLRVNGQLIIDAWKDQDITRYTGQVTVPGGPVTVVMEFYEGVGTAAAKLDWGLVGSAGEVIQPSAGVAYVQDNGEGYWLYGGPWADWETIPVGYNGSALRSRNSDSTSRDYNWARWYNTLPRAGWQEVYVFVPATDNLTTAARYWVRTSGGYRKVIVDQRAAAGKWVSLGVHYFTGYYYEFVSLSDVSGEPDRSTWVVWDAVMLVPRAAPPG